MQSEPRGLFKVHFCNSTTYLFVRIAAFVDSRIINDPIVLNKVFPNGLTKKQHQDFYTRAIDSVKERDNRMHPFGFAELKDQLDDLEKLEEQMRRSTRGKSIRAMSGNFGDNKGRSRSVDGLGNGD